MTQYTKFEFKYLFDFNSAHTPPHVTDTNHRATKITLYSVRGLLGTLSIVGG